MSNWEGGNDINEMSHISYKDNNQYKDSMLLEDPMSKSTFKALTASETRKRNIAD